MEMLINQPDEGEGQGHMRALPEDVARKPFVQSPDALQSVRLRERIEHAEHAGTVEGARSIAVHRLRVEACARRVERLHAARQEHAAGQARDLQGCSQT